ncbi:MAG: glycosyltransferase family 1 protein [Gemmatimonadetes bacterium]|nr:MAG: glycosyltransferase family 1 protein [Gemmatimonadota bacterium]
MNILMHCVYFPPEVGGLESHVFYLCRALAARGHRVDIVTSRSRPGLPAHEVMDGVGVWRTWMPGRNTLGWALHAAGSTPRLASLAREADILHAQAFQSVLPCVVARRVRGAPVVTTWHTSHFLKRADHPFWAPVLGRMLRWSDYNLAASREIAEVGERLAPGVRVEALTNGVETDRFRPVEPALPRGGRPRLVVPRRLFEKNGVEYFVRALPLIVERIDVEALLVGDGPERARLEALAHELGVAERITFLGARPNDEMPGLLCAGDLAVFPSLMEATSVAALECMACGVPVAASNVGGLPEIVDDEVGGLFRPADPEDLARTVVRLLEDPALSERGRRARERVVNHWSNARLAERHLEIYRQLLEAKGRLEAVS